MEGNIAVVVLMMVGVMGPAWGLPARTAEDAPVSGYFNMHPLMAIHSSYPNSAYIPLSAPPPPNLVTYETVEHLPQWPMGIETRGLSPFAPASQLDAVPTAFPLAWIPYGAKFAKHSDVSPKGIAFHDSSNGAKSVFLKRKYYDVPVSLLRPELSTVPVFKMDPKVVTVSRSTLSTEQVAVPISSLPPVIAIPAPATATHVEEKANNPLPDQAKELGKVTNLNDFVADVDVASSQTRRVREAPTWDLRDDLTSTPLTPAPLQMDAPLPLFFQSTPEEVSETRSARQSNIGVIPLPDGVKPFQGFIKSPSSSSATAESHATVNINPSEIFVVNPEVNVPQGGSNNPLTTPSTQPQAIVYPGGTDYYHHVSDKDGSYTFQYEYGDISRHEWGFLRTVPGLPDPILVKEGFYTYPGANGELYRVDYVADDGGFRIRTSPLRRRMD